MENEALSMLEGRNHFRLRLPRNPIMGGKNPQILTYLGKCKGSEKNVRKKYSK